MLTELERGRLRDLVAREAVKQRVPNPLVTEEEKEKVGTALLEHGINVYSNNNSDQWEHVRRVISNTARILVEKEK